MSHRPGRSLEVLVAAIESALSGSDVTVRSPDSIIGLLSKKAREIDVSLRGPVGSTDLSVFFECRDRSKRQGPTWIEQIATKRKDVGANLAVAVSSSGFTPAALRLAKELQVAVRLLDDINTTDIKRLFGVDVVPLLIPQLRFERIDVHPREDGARAQVLKTDPIRFSSAPEDWSRPIFGRGDRAPDTSLDQLQQQLRRKVEASIDLDRYLPNELPKPGESATISRQRYATLYRFTAQDGAYLESSSGRIPLIGITLTYTYVARLGTMMVEGWKAYGSQGDAIAHAAVGEIGFGAKQRVALIRTATADGREPTFVLDVRESADDEEEK
jgi:hypothetical protein